MTRTLFVTGTDTEVGKTFVAAKIVEALRRKQQSVGVYKPVASGCYWSDGNLLSQDAVLLHQAAGEPLDLELVCPQRFAAPLAPPRAAALEGTAVDVDQLRSGLEIWQTSFSTVVVEGAGGFLSPLADGMLNADFAGAIDAEVVIVAANRLGVINHTLLTVDACNHRLQRLPLAIVLNDHRTVSDDSAASNRAEIARYARSIPVLHVEHGGSIDFPF